MDNIVILDNATLRGSLTALNYLQDTTHQDIKDYDIQLIQLYLLPPMLMK